MTAQEVFETEMVHSGWTVEQGALVAQMQLEDGGWAIEYVVRFPVRSMSQGMVQRQHRVAVYDGQGGARGSFLLSAWTTVTE